MRFDKLTTKFQQALSDAQSIAVGGDNPHIEPQHLLLARMRAVENGRWLLRPSNDGITASIDPAGRVWDQLPERKRLAGRLRFTPSGVPGAGIRNAGTITAAEGGLVALTLRRLAERPANVWFVLRNLLP